MSLLTSLEKRIKSMLYDEIEGEVISIYEYSETFRYRIFELENQDGNYEELVGFKLPNHIFSGIRLGDYISVKTAIFLPYRQTKS